MVYYGSSGTTLDTIYALINYKFMKSLNKLNH